MIAVEGPLDQVRAISSAADRSTTPRGGQQQPNLASRLIKEHPDINSALHITDNIVLAVVSASLSCGHNAAQRDAVGTLSCLPPRMLSKNVLILMKTYLAFECHWRRPRQCTDGLEHVIAYANRTLIPDQRNNPATKDDCLALVWANKCVFAPMSMAATPRDTF